MATRNANPKSFQQIQREIVRAQPSDTSDKSPFSGGAYQDLDGSLIPANGVHEVENYRCHPHGLIGRGGSELWGVEIPDGLDNNGPFACTKAGSIVTIAEGGREATVLDLGRWIKHDEGRCERIIEILGPRRFVVDDSYARAASSAAVIVVGVMAQLRHEQFEAQIVQVGTKLYYSYTNPIQSWTEIQRVGQWYPSETKGVLRQLGENYALLYNDNGVFKIDLEKGVYYRANSAIPTVIPTDIEKNEERVYARRVTYSMVRLKDHGQNSQRYDAGVSIVQETGTCKPGAGGKDFATICTRRPIGDGTTTRGVLLGAVLTGGYDVIGGWSAVSAFQFGITIDGVTRNCVGDASPCVSMDQVAEKIQLSIRDHFPKATCKFVTNYFLFETNTEGSTIGQISSGQGTLDISSIIGPGQVVASTFTEPAPPVATYGIGPFEIPIDELTGDYDTHYNRYGYHTTLDIGDNGENPITRDQNDPELFIHNSDIPVAKALIASATNNVVTVNASDNAGLLVIGDGGCILRFQSGGYVTLTTPVYENDGSFLGKQFNCAEATTFAEQACAIGGDETNAKAIRVMTVSVVGGVATRTAGATFTAADKGKILFLSNGDEVTLKSYTDANNFTVVETGVIAASVAGCLDPRTRRWTDTVRDDVYETQPNLRSRITLQTTQNRLFSPMPNCNRGDISGSMIWGAESGKNKIHYSSIKPLWKHFGGYYYEPEQFNETDDNIEEVSVIGSTLTIKCRRKTHKIPTNQFSEIELSQIGVVITKSAGIFDLDGAVGIRHFGGVCNIPGVDRQIVITGEPAIRELTEAGYGENYATGRIQKILDRMVAEYSTRYDPVNGFTVDGWLVKLL